MSIITKGTLTEFYGFKVFKNLNLKEDEYKFEKDKCYVGINVYDYLKKIAEQSWQNDESTTFSQEFQDKLKIQAIKARKIMGVGK